VIPEGDRGDVGAASADVAVLDRDADSPRRAISAACMDPQKRLTAVNFSLPMRMMADVAAMAA